MLMEQKQRKPYPKNRKSSSRKGINLGKKPPTLPRTCATCGDTFMGYPNKLYCSRKCHVTAFIDQAPGDACWTWKGYKRHKGYGEMYFDVDGRRIKMLAHRVVYEEFVGDTGGLCLCHKCDNPSCVRPDHLFLGTKADNTADRNAKGRQARGETNGSAKLTEDDIRHIRSTSASARELAEKYGVWTRTIHVIRAGKTWKHVA